MLCTTNKRERYVSYQLTMTTQRGQQLSCAIATTGMRWIGGGSGTRTTLYERFVLPRWQDLEVYDGDTTKASEGRNLEHGTPSHTPAANPDRPSNARMPGSWSATS